MKTPRYTHRPRLIWCDESDRMLGELAKSGMPRSEWISELNKVTGGKITKTRQITARMHRLRITLSEDIRKSTLRRAGKKKAQREIMMNDARKAYVKDVYYSWMSIPEILVEVNKMPGIKIKDVNSMVYCIHSAGFKRGPRPVSEKSKEVREREARARHREKMKEKFGVTRPNRAKTPRFEINPDVAKQKAIYRPVIAESAAPPVERVKPSPELADMAVLSRQARARAALMKKNADPMDVAKSLNMPPHEVFRLYGEMRRAGLRA